MQADFTDQQKEMLERFRKLKVGALFSQMGTGKTRVAVELANYNNPDFLLYICPFSCKSNIEAELIKWGLHCPFRLVGYETLSASDRIYIEIRDELQKHERNFIIADESIFIKNGRTKRHTRAKDLRSLCEWALVLNGTPIVNNERDIYNQMEFLSPEIFKMRYYQFLRTFFTEHAYRRNGKEIHIYEFYAPNRPAFSKIIAPYVYQADLLFEKEESEQHTWTCYDADRYEAVKEEVLTSYKAYDTDSIIDLFTKLATVASEDEQKNAEVIKYITGKKVIVYCSRRREVAQIRKGCDCYVIDGDTKEADRKRIIKDFTEGKNKPLVLTFGVGAYSLNLQAASEIVYSSLTFNFGQYEQSRFRIKRIGQESNITYRYILAGCNINQTMLENLHGKSSLAETIKNHIKKADIKDWLKKAV